MNIVFFGSPATAIVPLKALKDAGHRITLIVTQPDRPSGRGKRLTLSPVKKFALKHNITVFQPNRIRKDPLAIEKLQAAAPDLNIVVAYGQFLQDSIIYFPRYHSLNIHYSLLPKYRGASPVQWAILNGEKSTGITIFELNAKMDEGLILAQKES
ncbi:MAG: methionyl-tRNA formyltransferase, partial [Candidatus Aminicenantes bacterium]|nr:methionyl-tRNA formyltransferase [Candidatus Aminicenantes bacterium]